MPNLIEPLESRTLLSSTTNGLGDYDAVFADATAVKTAVTSAATTLTADAKIIAVDIKALGRNKTNNVDIVKVDRAELLAVVADKRYAAKIYAAGSVALKRVKIDVIADLTNSTAKNDARLATAVALLSAALAPSEALLAGAITTGAANVDSALGVLSAANPTDTKLATDITAAETDQTSLYESVSGAVETANDGIYTLVGDIEAATT